MINYECLKTLGENTSHGLAKLIMQEGLIDKAATIPRLMNYPFLPDTCDIFFGTGISNPNELSTGVPFDFLIYPLIAVRLRKALSGQAHVHHLIADDHALINQFDKRVVRKLAADLRKRIEDIIERLGIDDYHVYLASEIATDKKYRALIASGVDAGCISRYSTQEAADIEYFYQTRDALLKIGWKFKGQGLFDEHKFDDDYFDRFGSNIVPIYVAAGKRFSDRNPNCVPYTLYKNELNSRIILNRSEDVLQKLSSAQCSDLTKRMVQNHYKGLVRLFESTIRTIPGKNKTVWEKVEYIIRLVTD